MRKHYYTILMCIVGLLAGVGLSGSVSYGAEIRPKTVIQKDVDTASPSDSTEDTTQETTTESGESSTLSTSGNGSSTVTVVPGTINYNGLTIFNNEAIAGLTEQYNKTQEEKREVQQNLNIMLTNQNDFIELLHELDDMIIEYQDKMDVLEEKKQIAANTTVALQDSLEKAQAEELYKLAEEKDLVLMVALKTAYTPAFGHLFSLLKSLVIGDIVEVNASVTTLTDESSEKLDSKRIGGSMSENACFPLLPIFKFLGMEYRNINFYSKMKNDVDMFTKAVFRYDHAVASFQVGLGVKTEGSMTIAGTKGYVYVPAPWWKTDYFEVRYEDQNQNKKYFYPFVGEGLRYEIKDFVASVLSNGSHFSKVSKNENIRMAEVQEQYIKGVNLYKI